MDKKVRIEMKDETQVFLADLKESDLENVKLTLKDNEPNLTMKSETVREDDKFQYDRRLYKWATMPKLVMYDLKVPKTLEAFKEVTSEKDILEYAVGNYAIEADKLHNGVTGINEEKKDEKSANKLLANLKAAGATDKEVEAQRKVLVKCGFLK